MLVYQRTPFDSPRRCRDCRRAPPEVGNYCLPCHERREEYYQEAADERRRECNPDE